VISAKIIKVPSKRVKLVLSSILDDYYDKKTEGEYFHSYATRQEPRYFYNMLKPIADTSTVTDSDFIDWGHDEEYLKKIGIGECAGVVIDLVATLLLDVEEKLNTADSCLANNKFSDSIYHSYSSMVNAGKAALTTLGKATNTQSGIVSMVDDELIGVENSGLTLDGTFTELVFEMNNQDPTKEFATKYAQTARDFYKKVVDYREEQLKAN